MTLKRKKLLKHIHYIRSNELIIPFANWIEGESGDNHLKCFNIQREFRAHVKKQMDFSVNDHWRVESRTCGGLNWEDMGKFDQGELDLFEDC